MPEWLKNLNEKLKKVEKSETGIIKIGEIKDLPANFFHFLNEKEARKIRIDDNIVIYGHHISFIRNNYQRWWHNKQAHHANE